MRFQRAFGGRGVVPGKFEGPWGVAALRGLVIVAEFQGQRVQLLTPRGVPLQVLPSLGLRLTGVCCNDERVWVTDFGAHVVHVLLFA